jgi:hypothetical protein
MKMSTVNFIASGNYSLTPPERIGVLIDAVRYLHHARTPGSVVECGVWRGGSMMAAARTLIQCDEVSRELWLYDTYTGMSEPSDSDSDLHGHSAEDVLVRIEGHGAAMADWCNAPLADVQKNMRSMEYPDELLHYVIGKVEETVQKDHPKEICLLRLDTDWYESTYASLVTLYPLVARGGILILDDYGHWQGARKAVDQYFAEQSVTPFLVRTDYAARVIVKG